MSRPTLLVRPVQAPVQNLSLVACSPRAALAHRHLRRCPPRWQWWDSLATCGQALCLALMPVPPLAHTPAPLSLGQAQALGAALGVASRGAWPSFTRRASVLLSVRMVGLCLGVSHRWVSRCLCHWVCMCVHTSHTGSAC